MKLKLNLLHKVGLAVLAVGLIILIFGLTVLYKYEHARDISELELGDIKKGMYIKGTITEVIKGYPLDAETTGRSSVPLDLYTTQSQDTTDSADLTYFLIELRKDSGEYICVAIDEYLDTDLYYQIFSGAETPYELEGIVTYSESEEQIVMNSVRKIGDHYSDIYYEHRLVKAPTVDNVSPCCIKVKYLGTRKLWWLYSIPFMFAGIAIFLIGGRPYERIK